jgi:type VI secretion system protein ImpG
MSFNRYYQDELSYLRELGAEFARENPNLAPFLSRESSDPDVERLLEGFAFLTGRLRQKLDDELPELTHSLLQLMWPHFLRPIPAMTVVQFEPLADAGGEERLVPRGVEIASRPLDGTSCKFRTGFDLPLVPAQVSSVKVENTSRSGFIEVGIRLFPDVSPADIGLGRLRFYLLGERGSAAARMTYLSLLKHCRRIVVTDSRGAELVLSSDRLRPVGLTEDESLLPTPEGVAPGFLLLQEYFAFPDKFMFVELSGLEPVAGFSGNTLKVVFELDQPFELASGLNNDSIRLNCVPAVNLFEADADPVSVDHRKTEYRLTARDTTGRALDIHSVRQVSGWVQGRGARIAYHPFEAFRSLLGDQTAVYYAMRRRPAVVGNGVDTYVSFVRNDGSEIVPDVETVSLAVSCTNGRLAEHIVTGHLDQPTSTTSSFVRFRNIQPISPQIPPPIGVGLLWPLISNMALNFGSLLTVEAIRVLMTTYHFRAHFDAQERRRLDIMVEGTTGVSSKAMDWVLRGFPVRGTDIQLLLEESKFGGEGEVFLFGTVLNRFLDLFANINSVHRLGVRGSERNVVYQWPIRTGTRPNL